MMKTKPPNRFAKKIEWIVSGDKDVIAFAGNPGNPAMRKSFMILGFCYPKIDLQRSLL